MRQTVKIFLVIFFLVACFSSVFAEDDYARLQRIGGQMNSIMGSNCQFSILSTGELNAYYQNGSVQITSGLLAILNNDSLALILGHEIAHGIGRHGEHQTSGGLVWGLLGAGLSALCKGNGQAITNGFVVGSSLGANSYSRADEYRADEAAMVAVKRAGYDPNRAIQGFYEIKQRYGDGMGSMPFLSLLASHPPTSNRISRLESQAQDSGTANNYLAQNSRSSASARIAVIETDPKYVSSRLATEFRNFGCRVTLTGGELYTHVMNNQNLQGFDPSTAPRRNKLTGNTLLAFPEFKVTYPGGSSKWGSTYYQSYGYASENSQTTKIATLNLRLVDSETGELIASTCSERKINTNTHSYNHISTPDIFISGGGSGYDTGEVSQEDIDGMISEAVGNLTAQIPSEPERVAEFQRDPSEQIVQSSDVVIYSNYHDLIEISIGTRWNKAFRVTTPDGILRITKIGHGKYVKAKIGNVEKTGITPCVLDLR